MNRQLLAALLLGLLLAGLAGCQPLATPLPPLPTATPLPPTITPTGTPVWFPPTATHTPWAPVTVELTPTMEVQPQFGDLLFRDDFSDDSLWSLGRSAFGSAALGKNELTLAGKQTRRYISSLRAGPQLGDFYAEITASPSICRGLDEYGLLLRASSNEQFYRFALTCDGQVRVDKYFNGRASAPQPLTFHGAVPPGAPSSSRLGVSAAGREFHFYVNGEYVFSVSDPSILSGSLGVFARPAGEDPMTVNFSELVVYALAR
jgi:hypothetical protein